MAAVGSGLCGECEVCAAAPEQWVPPDDAADASRSRGRRRGRRRRSPCVRCGHPIRLHQGAEGRHSVVGALLPEDLPPTTSAAPPPPTPDPVVAVVPDVEPDAVAGDPMPYPAEPAPVGDSLVDRIRALTELYKAGMLDDDEFAAAKAVVLRDPSA